MDRRDQFIDSAQVGLKLSPQGEQTIGVDGGGNSAGVVGDPTLERGGAFGAAPLSLGPTEELLTVTASLFQRVLR